MTPLNILVVTLADMSCNTVASLCACTLPARCSSLQSEHRNLFFGGHYHYCSPWLASCVRITYYCSHSCLPAAKSKSRKLGNCYHTEDWNWLIVTAIYQLSFPLEVQEYTFMLEFQNSYISFCHNNCYLGIQMDSWHSLLCHFPGHSFLLFLIICEEGSVN